MEPAIDASDHIVKPGPQGDERDDQFGGVAESRIEKPANSLAHTLCELFGGPA
jgi:hypothetical protein